MLHNLGHRTEDSLARPYGGWQLQPPVTPWDRYAANALESPGHTAGVGTCEVPANAAGHYDYANPGTVPSSACDWANFPNLTGAVTPATPWPFHLIDFPLISDMAGTEEWAHCSKIRGQERVTLWRNLTESSATREQHHKREDRDRRETRLRIALGWKAFHLFPHVIPTGSNRQPLSCRRDDQ